MTTNTNTAQVANNVIAATEDQAFDAWYKQDCLVGGVNARIAARAAWNARADLTTAAAVPPEGWVMVPEEPDERMERAIAGAFCGTVYEAREAWAAGIAAAPKAEPVPAGEYPPLPEWSKMDNLGGLVPSEIRQELRAYVDSDRALRAQAAPAAVAVRESFDADGFKEWVKRNLPDDTIIGSSEWWANHLTLWAQRFFTVSAAPQPPAQVQEPFGYFRAEPFGWTDCEADEDGAKALYEHPAPQPAPVAQGDAQPMQPSDDDVICPSCSHQFRAIPVNVQKLMLDAGIAPPFTSSAQKDVAMDTFQKNGIAWAVDRWKSEVMNRPMRNLHRRSLDDAWRQVVRYFGGCPDTLLGPCHDASRAQAEEGGAS